MEEQNMTLIFKVKSQGHRVDALKSQYLTNIWLKGVDFDMCTHITREGFLGEIMVAVSFFQNCAIHPYS